MALRIGGDRAAFYECGFFGAQDTLHDDRGRHYFRLCFIQGSIDFIFGNAKSLYHVIQLHPPHPINIFMTFHTMLFLFKSISVAFSPLPRFKNTVTSIHS